MEMDFMIIKPKILTFVRYYLPGYKAGGPLRSISNIVDNLSNDFEFWIITCDHDLGDDTQYADISINEWTLVDKAHVFYASSNQLTFKWIVKIIKDTPHDEIYLNSFFDSVFTIMPLLARRFCQLVDVPLLLAPRGEFSPGALCIKTFKKKFYIYLANFFGLYKDIYWHASTEYEVEDIKRAVLTINNTILVALDLPTMMVFDQIPSEESDSNILRVVFLSRISPKKNLDYALRILKQVTAPVVFDIYGPIEDDDYWQLCLGLCHAMPENITITYRGGVLPKDVATTFADYDLFLFPTRGENYGHVIAESLSVGTPVLLSNQTPWQNLEADGLGWSLPLDDMVAFVNILESVAFQTKENRYSKRKDIRQKIAERLFNPELIEENKQLFYKSIKKLTTVNSHN